MSKTKVPAIPVEVEATRLGDIHIGYWRFGVYIGDTIPWGADGITDPRTGVIMVGEHLPDHHRWPILVHEYFEAVCKVWNPSLDLDHDQIQILGECVAHSFPDLIKLWWSLASPKERRRMLGELMEPDDDEGELDEGVGVVRSGEASFQGSPPEEDRTEERIHPS